MAGFDNDVVYAGNVDFRGVKPIAGQITTDGQLLIGSTATPNIKVGTITSGDSSITVTPGSGTLALSVTGGTTVGKTITGDTGGALSPTAGNWNLLGTGSITTAGAGSTLTTQLTGLTNHNVLVGAGNATITKVAPSATSGVPLISQGAAADPAFGTAVVAGGGTGQTTLTDHGVLVGSGTSPVNALAVGTNGQVLVGSTGANPVFATLAGTGGITFTTGAGTLTINGTGGGVSWSVVSVNATLSVNTGTIANKAGLLTMTLPTTSAVGDVIEITGINTAVGWRIAQNANQQIHFGQADTTIGATGYIESQQIRDSLKIVCVVANLEWNVITSIGNLTVN